MEVWDDLRALRRAVKKGPIVMADELPANGSKVTGTKRRPAEKPTPGVIFGRQLRDQSDIKNFQVPLEFRVDPAKVYVDSLVVERLSDVKELAVDWLWPGRISFLCTTHLRPGSSAKAVYRAAGNLSFTTAARAVWALVHDALDPARRLMVPVKMNLAPDAEGLSLRIDEEGKVVWEPEPVQLSANRALQADQVATQFEKTMEWLRGVLAEGPQEARVVLALGEEVGFARTTIRRAAGALGVRMEQFGTRENKGSRWSLAKICP